MKIENSIKNVADVRRFFKQNEIPITFLNETPVNLLGIEDWISNFKHVNAIDCFDGQNPSVFVPKKIFERRKRPLTEVHNELLLCDEVANFIRARGRGKILTAYYDDQTIGLCEELGQELSFPAPEIANQIDDKLNATKIAEKSGVRVIPSVVGTFSSYEELKNKTRELGTDLVLQKPFGAGGSTTYFVSGKEDWNSNEESLAGTKVKAMKRIQCRETAIEACVTENGVVVGPLMSELIGFDRLTNHAGGWCGNEISSAIFDEKLESEVRDFVVAFGDEIFSLGYRGFYEVDFLIEDKTGLAYFGECNPRLTGATNLTNLSVGSFANAPLILFHLLTSFGLDSSLDVDSINSEWKQNRASQGDWSQMIFKVTNTLANPKLGKMPRSGVWELGANGCNFVAPQYHKMTVDEENQGFFLRTASVGDELNVGTAIGRLVTGSRSIDANGNLTDSALKWIESVHAMFGI